MRKPSEIIDKASRDPRYRPVSTRLAAHQTGFLCLLLGQMYLNREITYREKAAAIEQVRIAIGGFATLTTLLSTKAGVFVLSRRRYTLFWRKLVKDLQSRGL